MNLLKRISNLWKLSEFKPREVGSAPLEGGTTVAQMIRPPEVKGQFIPFKRRDPIKELVNEQPE